jgi:hypothetical protein
VCVCVCVCEGVDWMIELRIRSISHFREHGNKLSVSLTSIS